MPPMHSITAAAAATPNDEEFRPEVAGGVQVYVKGIRARVWREDRIEVCDAEDVLAKWGMGADNRSKGQVGGRGIGVVRSMIQA